MKTVTHVFGLHRPSRHLACMMLDLVLAMLLVLVLAPTHLAQAAPTDATTTFDYEPGSYVEGEAIALVISSVQDGLTVQSDDLLSSAQTLMDISNDAVQGERETGALTVQEDSVLQSSDDGATQRLVLVRDDSKTTEQLVSELQADPRVVFAEPNLYVTVDENSNASDGSTTPIATPASSTTTIATTPTPSPTDAASQITSQSSDISGSTTETNAATVFATEQSLTTYPDLTDYQWGDDNDGHWAGSGTEGIDIDYSAWNTSMGMDVGPVIAVIDTGVDETNPDLMHKMWRDGASYPGLMALGGR